MQTYVDDPGLRSEALIAHKLPREFDSKQIVPKAIRMAITVFEFECGQGIQLGEAITVKVVRIKRNTVHLEIEAPNKVPIYRGEVADAVASVLPLPHSWYQSR